MAAARHGHHDRSARGDARAAVHRRRAVGCLRPDRRRARARARRPRHHRAVPAAAADRLPQPVRGKDRPEHRLSGLPGLVRAVLRRLVRPRARRQPGEVRLSARTSTPTTSSRSSARSSGCSGRCWCSACSRCSATPASGSRSAARTGSASWPRPGATAWLLGQALVNMGAVVGLLPITGIPLPLVSFGGSALVPTMFAIGMLISFARREPATAKALAARKAARGSWVPKVAWSRMNVLLAGGGSAGHVSPLLALADRLVADDPHDAGSGPRAPRAGSRPGWCRPVAIGCMRSRGFRCRAGRRCKALRLPADLRAAVRSARSAIDAGRRRRRGRLRRLRRGAGLPRRAAGRRTDRRARAEQPARLRQPARRLADPLGGGQLSRTRRCGTRCVPVCRCGRRSPGWIASAQRRSARASFGLRPGPTDPARVRRIARCAAAQPGRPRSRR